MVWIILAMAYPFILFAKYMFSHFGPLFKRLIKIENMYHWNGAIKTFMQTYVQILIASLANLIAVDPKNSAEKVSWVMSYTYVAFSIFFFFFSIFYVYFNRRYLDQQKFLHSWGSLLVNGELKTDKSY
jgi:hypothetical protein